jgi:hypothetical protein
MPKAQDRMFQQEYFCGKMQCGGMKASSPSRIHIFLLPPANIWSSLADTGNEYSAL